MNLREKIQSDFKEAFKNKEEMRLNVLKMLNSEIHNAEINKRAKSGKEEVLDDDGILEVILREIKKRKDAISLYEQGGRKELAEAEKKEMEILSAYLPEQLSEGEVRELVQKAIKDAGATSIKEMGKVMSILMPQIKGRADNSLVSNIVKEILGA